MKFKIQLEHDVYKPNDYLSTGSLVKIINK